MTSTFQDDAHCPKHPNSLCFCRYWEAVICRHDLNQEVITRQILSVCDCGKCSEVSQTPVRQDSEQLGDCPRIAPVARIARIEDKKILLLRRMVGLFDEEAGIFRPIYRNRTDAGAGATQEQLPSRAVYSRTASWSGWQAAVHQAQKFFWKFFNALHQI